MELETVLPFPIGDEPIEINLSCPMCGGEVAGQIVLHDMGADSTYPGPTFINVRYRGRIEHACRSVRVTVTRQVIDDKPRRRKFEGKVNGL